MPSLLEAFATTVAGDPTVQAKAVATAISVVMGFTPQVVTGKGYAQVVFTPEQETAVVEYMNRLLAAKPSGSGGAAGPGSSSGFSLKVRMDIKMIVIRVFLKNFWFVLAGPFVGGFLTGRRTAKKNK